MFRKRSSLREPSQLAQPAAHDDSVIINVSELPGASNSSQASLQNVFLSASAPSTDNVVINVTSISSSAQLSTPQNTNPSLALSNSALTHLPTAARRPIQPPPPLAKADTAAMARYRVWRDATHFLSTITLHGGTNRNRRTLSVATHLDEDSNEAESTTARDLGLDVIHVADINNMDRKLLVGSRVIFTSPSGCPIVTTTMLEPKISRKRRFAGLELPSSSSKEVVSTILKIGKRQMPSVAQGQA